MRARELQVQQDKQKQQLYENFHKKLQEMDMSHRAESQKMKMNQRIQEENDKRRVQDSVKKSPPIRSV